MNLEEKRTSYKKQQQQNNDTVIEVMIKGTLRLRNPYC
jgi:hypothetical protein